MIRGREAEEVKRSEGRGGEVDEVWRGEGQGSTEGWVKREIRGGEVGEKNLSKESEGR